MAVSQLVQEQRRHWRISFGLMTACVVGGVSVSNERGVFMPVGGVGSALAATARAFAAIVGPPGSLPLEPYSLFFPSGRIEGGQLPSTMIARVLQAPAQPPFVPGFGGPYARPGTGAGPGQSGDPAAAGDGQVSSTGDGTPIANGSATGIQPPTFMPFDPVGRFGTSAPGIGGAPFGNPPPTGGGDPGGSDAPPTGDGPGDPPPVTLLPPPGTPVPGNPPPTFGPNNPDPRDLPRDPDEPGTPKPELPESPIGGIPEPANWALLILGFGLIGAVQRLSARRLRRIRA